MSGHTLWADMSDPDDEESLSDWGEERLLPETIFDTSGSQSSIRTTPQEMGGSFAGEHHQARSPKLNIYAPEFLPTLSMACPLVGVCEVIVEGDESNGNDEGHLLLPEHAAAPAAGRHPVHARKASSKQYWRNKPRPADLQVELPAAPQNTHREDLTEEQIQRRARSIEVGMQTKEYQFHVEQGRFRWPGAELLTPDPCENMSKRCWMRALQCWREELRRSYLMEFSLDGRPEAASVASTEAEETQGSELDDSATVTSDDASSAHWSSR
jgi:hypothetical protein